jgi:1,6-anhydro-N-acetylmuramate kinase
VLNTVSEVFKVIGLMSGTSLDRAATLTAFTAASIARASAFRKP